MSAAYFMRSSWWHDKTCGTIASYDPALSLTMLMSIAIGSQLILYWHRRRRRRIQRMINKLRESIHQQYNELQLHVSSIQWQRLAQSSPQAYADELNGAQVARARLDLDLKHLAEVEAKFNQYYSTVCADASSTHNHHSPRHDGRGGGGGDADLKPSNSRISWHVLPSWVRRTNSTNDNAIKTAQNEKSAKPTRLEPPGAMRQFGSNADENFPTASSKSDTAMPNPLTPNASNISSIQSSVLDRNVALNNNKNLDSAAAALLVSPKDALQRPTCKLDRRYAQRRNQMDRLFQMSAHTMSAIAAILFVLFIFVHAVVPDVRAFFTRRYLLQTLPNIYRHNPADFGKLEAFYEYAATGRCMRKYERLSLWEQFTYMLAGSRAHYLTSRYTDEHRSYNMYRVIECETSDALQHMGHDDAAQYYVEQACKLLTTQLAYRTIPVMISRTSDNQYRSRPNSALFDTEYSSLIPLSEMNVEPINEPATAAARSSGVKKVSGDARASARDGSRRITTNDDLKDYLDAQNIDLFGQEHDSPYNPKRPSAEEQEKLNKKRALSKNRKKTAAESKSDFQFTRTFIYEDDPIGVGNAALEHQPPRTQIKATDFVLVYERDLNSFITASPTGGKNNKIDTDWLGVPKKVRSYLNQVRNAGLEVSEPIEIEKADGDATTCFVGIHAPVDVLLEMAPLFNVKEKSVIHDEEDFIATLLRQHAARESGRRSSGMQKLYHVGFGQWIERLRGMWAGKEYHLHDYVTLRRLSLDRIDVEHQLFHQKDRSFIVAEMLERVIYGDAARAEFGVSRLLREGQFKASYPLHEAVEREFLLSRWACWKSMLRPQPLHVIRNYFGEKLGMYYAWMDMYTRWLGVLALIGIIVFIYSQAEYGADAISREVCGLSERDDRIMCPDCDSCPYWRLSSSCHARKIAHIWDNSSSIVYAYLLSFWAVAFLVFWEREAARLAHLWATYDHDIEEHIYIGYTMRADLKYRNPLTGNDEPRVSARKRWTRLIISWTISLMFVVACVAASIMVILFRTWLHNRLLTEWGTASRARAVSVYVATVANVASILTIYRVYVVVAKHLTRYEIHELKSGEESSYAVKLFLYQCINFYFPIAYVAFFKGRYIGEPGRYRRVLGMRLETCRVGGCFADTAKMMTIFFCAKQIMFQCNELLLPKIMGFFKNRKRRHAVSNETLKTFPPALEYQLLNYEGEVTFEYLEMTVQYGFVTMFSSAFPLAAFFALLNNVLEIRIDAQKISKKCRRPVAMQAKNIGVWYKMLYFITELSIWTNAFLVGFTSESPIYRTFAAHPGSFNSFSYVNETLQKAADEQNDAKSCYYHSLNGPDGEDTVFGLRVWKRRMVHVITFIAVTHLLRWILETFLAQTPKSVKDLLRMERQWQMGGTSAALAARAEEKEAARSASFNTTGPGGELPPRFALGNGMTATGGGAESDSAATRDTNRTAVAAARPRRNTLSRRRRPTKSFAQDEFGNLHQPSRNAATHARLLTPTPGAPSTKRQTNELDRFKSAMAFDDESSSAAEPTQRISASSAQTSFDSYDTLTGHKHHYLDERGGLRHTTQRVHVAAPPPTFQSRTSAAMMPMVSTTRVSGDYDNVVAGRVLPAAAGEEPIVAAAQQINTRSVTRTSGIAVGSRIKTNEIDAPPRRKAPRLP